jgi:hypothetical protein
MTKIDRGRKEKAEIEKTESRNKRRAASCERAKKRKTTDDGPQANILKAESADWWQRHWQRANNSKSDS